MHTGLLSIKGKNLTYINSYLYEKLLKITNIKEKIKKERISTELNLLSNNEELEKTDRINYLKNHLEMILRDLITKLNNENLSKYYLLI